MPPRRSTRARTNNNNNNNNNPNIAEIIAQQLAGLVPTIVAQVTAAVHQGNLNGADNNNNNNGADNNNNNNGGGNGCTYKEFLACKPKEFDGKGGAIALTRWVEKMEAVIDISNCAQHNRVRFAASSLINKALTWWNTQIQARGREAAMGMTWDEFKALLSEEFCPRNEMQRLETEFWNHAMVGANHAAYTDRFHELAKLVPHLVTPESKRIERYIYGLVPQIRGMVSATEPPTIQSAILKAGSLTDEMVRNGSLVKSSEKRKEFSESSKQGGYKGDSKKVKVERGSGTSNFAKKEYTGSAPKCSKCNYHHFPNIPCRVCINYNRGGHLARDCRV